MSNASSKAKQGAKQLEGETKEWVVRLARLGYAAKGTVYALIGIMAFEAAFGSGSTNINTQDALTKIITQPFGKVLLTIIVIGLIGYVIWEFVQAFADPEHVGSDAKGLAKRAASIFSGIGYAFLAYSGFRLLNGSGGSSNSTRDFTAAAMSNPIGRWVVGLVGVGLIVLGFLQFYRAYKEDFTKRLKKSEMSAEEFQVAKRTGQFGLSARGVVYLIIGYFLVQAAITYNPNKAGGLGKAFQTLASQPFGPWLLGLVAVGLIAYGIYAFILARYRRIYIR